MASKTKDSSSKPPGNKKRGSKDFGGSSSRNTNKKARTSSTSAASSSKTGVKHTTKKARTSSTPSASKNKSGVKHERQSQRRHAEVVNEAKEIWNKLRLKTITAKERRDLMDKLIPLIQGKANEIALQHDASRVVQAAVQFGTEQERRDIMKELCAQSGNFVELCKSQYAHFTVLKVVKYCHNDQVCLKLLMKALKGSMAKLFVHAVASRVVESIFTTLATRQKTVLKQELYGPHFALFASDTLQLQDAAMPTLASNLESAPDKKDQTLLFVRNLVNKGMEKSLYGYTYLQEILAEYVDVCNSNESRSMAASAADHVIHLLSTRAGTRAAAAFIAYGTAKDRKRIMKSLKGYTRSAILHHDAYLAIMRLVQLTDDTVSVQKNILNELFYVPDAKDDKEGASKDSPLLEIAFSDSASKLLLLILVEDDDILKKYLDPYERSVLAADPTVEEDGKEAPTSRKDAGTRRKELLKYLREPLIELCKNHSEQLLRSRPGSLVIREVHAAFDSEDVIASVIETCKKALNGDSNTENTDDGELPLFEDFIGHLTIKNLILSDSKPKPLFATAFLAAFDARMMDICKSNRGAFVVAALCEVPSTRDGTLKVLDKKKLLQRVKIEKGSTAGFEALLSAIEGKRRDV